MLAAQSYSSALRMGKAGEHFDNQRLTGILSSKTLIVLFLHVNTFFTFIFKYVSTYLICPLLIYGHSSLLRKLPCSDSSSDHRPSRCLGCHWQSVHGSKYDCLSSVFR